MSEQLCEEAVLEHASPQLPSRTAALLAVCSDEGASIAVAEAAIEVAPFLVASVLDLAGLADHTREATPTALLQAIDQVGRDTCRTMAFSDMLETDFAHTTSLSVAMHQRVVLCAAAARVLTEVAHPELTEPAVLAGLLALCAEITCAEVAPDTVSRLLEARHPFESDHELEVLGLLGPTVSGAICRQWGLPERISAAVAGRSSSLDEASPLAAVVKRAVLLADLVALGEQADPDDLSLLDMSQGDSQRVFSTLAELLPTLADQGGRRPLRVVSAARVEAAIRALEGDDAIAVSLGATLGTAADQFDELPQRQVLERYLEALEVVAGHSLDRYGEGAQVGAVVIEVSAEGLDDQGVEAAMMAVVRSLRGRIRAHELLGAFDSHTLVVIAPAVTADELGGAMRRLSALLRHVEVVVEGTARSVDLSIGRSLGDVLERLRGRTEAVTRDVGAGR